MRIVDVYASEAEDNVKLDQMWKDDREIAPDKKAENALFEKLAIEAAEKSAAEDAAARERVRLLNTRGYINKKPDDAEDEPTQEIAKPKPSSSAKSSHAYVQPETDDDWHAENARLTNLTGALSQLATFTPQVPRQEYKITEYEKDPITHLKQKTDLLEVAHQQMAQARYNEQVVTQNQQAVENFASDIAALDAQQRKNDPDYDAKIAFLKKTRREELAEVGLIGRELEAAVTQAITTDAITLRRLGKNPAAELAKVAVKRGFVPSVRTKTKRTPQHTWR